MHKVYYNPKTNEIGVNNKDKCIQFSDDDHIFFVLNDEWILIGETEILQKNVEVIREDIQDEEFNHGLSSTNVSDAIDEHIFESLDSEDFIDNNEFDTSNDGWSDYDN